MIFVISFAAIVACYNWAVIKSYVGYRKEFVDDWHYFQAAMVILERSGSMNLYNNGLAR